MYMYAVNNVYVNYTRALRYSPVERFRNMIWLVPEFTYAKNG